MKTFILLIVLAVATLYSCDNSTSASPEVSNICLVDISGSIDNSNLVFYLENIQKSIIPFLNEKNSLVLLAIDNGSQTAAVPLFEVDMSNLQFENPADPMTARKKLGEQRRKKYLQDISESFISETMKNIEKRKAYAKKTDIFGSLKQINRYAKNRTNVIIFSDMINYSEESNMEKIINSKISPLKSIEKMPIVKGNNSIQIYVCTGDNTNMGITAYNDLEIFWRTYFSQNEFNLIDYTSSDLKMKATP
ncbi:MAG: hypothetical protein JJE44_02070 [Flavobacteriaceae bacterium]|nr:hypothetical protein [Flavobacteriaceae bacterium]